MGGVGASVQMSCFNMDEADVEEHKTRFDLFDKEAKRMLAKRLPVPAYDQLLKSSHAFNVLDARGAVRSRHPHPHPHPQSHNPTHNPTMVGLFYVDQFLLSGHGQSFGRLLAYSAQINVGFGCILF